VVTLRFNKKNLGNFSTVVVQQPQGQPNKATPQKGKGPKQESSGSLAYLAKQSGEDQCRRCGGPYKKKV
jgi:hypothetical protein